VAPTFDAQDPGFQRDLERLTEKQVERSKAAVRQLAEDLDANRPLRPGLRVKRVQGTAGVYEMTWAPDGRATFEFGPEKIRGKRHVIWRRVGTHGIFKRP